MRTDRRRLLWLICLLLIPFLVAGIVWAFFSMDLLRVSEGWEATRKKYALIAFFVALAVVLAVIVVGWLRARRRDGGLEAGLSVGTGSRGELEAARKNWKESVAKLKETAVAGGGKRALAALPWYVIIGPPGGGKSTLLRGSGIDFPVGDAAIRGMQGTRNCDWWFSNVGIFLDTAGRYISDDAAAEWGQFLDLVRKHRIRTPINGVIVAVPAKTLLEASEAEQDLDARRIRARLDELIDHLGINFPVWIVVTKVDLVGGFVEFFGQSDPATRRQMMGWTLPPDEGGKFRVEDFERRYDVMVRKLREIRPAMVATARLRDRPAAFGFPDEMAGLGPPLARMLQRMFAPNVYQETPLLRGVYITSATQQGSALQKAAAKVREMLGAPAVDADAEASAVKHAYFVTDLMHERILTDQAMTWTTQMEVERGRHRRLGINLIGMSVGVLLAFLALAADHAGVRKLRQKVESVAKAESDESQVAVERVEEIRKVYDDFPKAGIFGLLSGEGAAKSEVRKREIERYRLSVLDVLEKPARAAIDALPKDTAPDAAQVDRVLTAWAEFEDAAAVVGAIADTVRKERRGAAPSLRDMVPLPVPGMPDPPPESYAAQGAVLTQALALRLAADPRARLLKEAGTLPSLRGAQILPVVEGTQPADRFALVVWRNHEFVKDADKWGTNLREAAKDALARWAKEQGDRIQRGDEFNRRAKDIIDTGLGEFRKQVTALADYAEDTEAELEDLRVAVERVYEACNGENFAPPKSGAEMAPTAPDWGGAEALKVRLATLTERDGTLAASIGAPAVRTQIDGWLAARTAAAGGAGGGAAGGERPTAGAVEAIRSAVRSLGADLKVWSDAVPKGAPSPPVKRTDLVSKAATAMNAVSKQAADQFDAKIASRLKEIDPKLAERAPHLKTTAQRLVAGSQVNGFLEEKGDVHYKRLASNVKLDGVAPHGAAPLRTVLESELLAPLTRADVPLPKDVATRLVEAAKVVFVGFVNGVQAEWATRVAASITPLRSADEYRIYLQQFDFDGDSGERVRTLALLADQEWQSGGPTVEPARTIWTQTVTFRDDSVVLHKDRVIKLWNWVKPLANASPTLEEPAYNQLVEAARARWGKPLPLSPTSPEYERVRIDEVREAYRTAELAVYESIVKFLNAKWGPVRDAVKRARTSGKPLAESEQPIRRALQEKLLVAFPNQTGSLGPILVTAGAWDALGDKDDTRAEEVRKLPIKVKVWFVRADFKNPETAPYLRVNYVDTDGSHMSDKWQGFAGTPFEFDWIPGKAKKFELLRCNDGGATTPLVGKNTDDACVIDLIYDGVPSGSDEFEWKSGDNVVKLRVWMDDWGRARGISTFNKTNKVVEPPANCVELGKR